MMKLSSLSAAMLFAPSCTESHNPLHKTSELKQRKLNSELDKKDKQRVVTASTSHYKPKKKKRGKNQ